MTLELRLLSFSTGHSHPLAEQPVIFITSESLPLEGCKVVIEIVGDFLVLLITFLRAQDEHEDIFFLVHWKKGEAHRVSDITAHSSPFAYILPRMPAPVLRVGNLLTFQFSFGRHPRHPQLDPEYTRNSQDRDQERRHPVPRSSMPAQPPSAPPTRLGHPSRLPRRTKSYRPRSPSHAYPI